LFVHLIGGDNIEGGSGTCVELSAHPMVVLTAVLIVSRRVMAAGGPETNPSINHVGRPVGHGVIVARVVVERVWVWLVVGCGCRHHVWCCGWWWMDGCSEWAVYGNFGIPTDQPQCRNNPAWWGMVLLSHLWCVGVICCC
jgi:hypothetical protein